MKNTLGMLLRHTLILVALFVGGCASVGKSFSYQEYRSLEPGKTRSEDYRTLFGRPVRVDMKDTEDGKFELASYVFAAANLLGSARVRILNLEFKDGVLNSYIYASSFDEGESSSDIAKLEQIERGASAKDQVLRTLGEPNGIALCPSEMPDFKDRCESVAEIYVWAVVAKLSTLGSAFGGDELESQTVFLGFNDDGIVESIEQVRSNEDGADK